MTGSMTEHDFHIHCRARPSTVHPACPSDTRPISPNLSHTPLTRRLTERRSNGATRYRLRSGSPLIPLLARSSQGLITLPGYYLIAPSAVALDRSSPDRGWHTRYLSIMTSDDNDDDHIFGYLCIYPARTGLPRSRGLAFLGQSTLSNTGQNATSLSAPPKLSLLLPSSSYPPPYRPIPVSASITHQVQSLGARATGSRPARYFACEV